MQLQSGELNFSCDGMRELETEKILRKNGPESGAREEDCLRICRNYKYPDPGVVDELKLGSLLTGDVPQTNVLPLKFTPSLLTCDALRMQSALRRDQILRKPGARVMLKLMMKYGNRLWRNNPKVG